MGHPIIEELTVPPIVVSPDRRRGFTLVELLVTISIIALLMGVLLVTLSMARNVSRRTACMSNFRQIHIATEVYLQSFKQTYYWRGANVSLDGMDWFTWGGRETGNLNQIGRAHV